MSASSLFSLRLVVVKERSPLFRGNATSLSQPALIRKGVFKNFFIFFRRAICHILYARISIARVMIHIYDARAYSIVFTNCQVRVKSIFLSGKFYTIPHPTHVPQAPSFHSTKILRYAIHAQYNYRGREWHTSGLICSQNSILGGLEARRARSIDLDEWLWG